MKLISLNLAIKINNTDNIINFIIKQNADIVCLQEVPNHKEESVYNTFKLKHFLDEALKDHYPYHYFSPLWQAKGFTKVDFGGYIEQGNYVLSKYKLTKTSNEFFHKSYIHTHDWSNVNFRTEDHGRALQTVEIEHKDEIIRVMNIHGIWTKDKLGDSRTINQSKFILERIKQSNIPTILTGDFNLLPDTQSIKILNKEMKNLILNTSYKTTRPEFSNDLENGGNIVDYVFINNKIKCKKFEVINTDISDHMPLSLEFELL